MTTQSQTVVTMPDIELRIISQKWKEIWIGGQKVGFLSKDSNTRFQGYNTFRKQTDWTGEFTWDGETFRVGPTEKVADLLPKVTRLVRSHLIRKNTKAGEPA